MGEELVYPDIKKCKAKFISSAVLVACLEPSPWKCPYSMTLKFGKGYFCWHPGRTEIASYERNRDDIDNND